MNAVVESPFAANTAPAADTAASRQNQSRELAETQTKYLMAERFPRDERAAMDRILNAFSRPTLAEKAAYQFARGGSDIAGPSIRAAEAMAQQWGNMDSGWRELQRGVGDGGVPFSEVEAFCVDLQARNTKRLQFIVRHWRDTKQGGYKLKDERDIYELCANMAQRRVRACILASLPGDVTEAAMQQAETTLRTKADTSPEAMHKMVETFAAYGVTKEHIEARIQRRLDAITPAQVVTLRRIFASLRDDMSTPAEWFDMGPVAPPADSTASLDAVKAATAAKRSQSSGKRGESVDRSTGEITSGAKDKGARTLADFKADIDNASDADTATIALDAARDVLSASEHEELSAHWKRAWKE